MPPPRRLLRFFALAALFFALLMAPWPGLERGYSHLFRRGGDVVFSSRFWFWPQARVRFLDLSAPDLVSRINAVIPGRLPSGFEPPPAQGVKDTLMVLINRDTPASTGQLRTSSRYVAFGPTAMIIALVLATPLSWRRRGWAFFWAFLLIHAFIALRLTLTLTANGFAADKLYALFHPSVFWRGMLGRVEALISDDPTVSFVVPAFIWFLVTFGSRAVWSSRASRPDDARSDVDSRSSSGGARTDLPRG